MLYFAEQNVYSATKKDSIVKTREFTYPINHK